MEDLFCFVLNADIVSFQLQTQEETKLYKGNSASSPGRVLELRRYRDNTDWLLTSPTQFNVAVTLCSTWRPISFEADKDCFCFTSTGLFMAGASRVHEYSLGGQLLGGSQMSNVTLSWNTSPPPPYWENKVIEPLLKNWLITKSVPYGTLLSFKSKSSRDC